MNIERVQSPPSHEVVALYRVQSRSEPDTFHDVALMAPAFGRAAYFDCTCAGFSFKDTCAHVVEVRRLWMAERTKQHQEARRG